MCLSLWVTLHKSAIITTLSLHNPWTKLMQCVDKVGHSRQSTRKMRTHAHSRRAGEQEGAKYSLILETGEQVWDLRACQWTRQPSQTCFLARCGLCRLGVGALTAGQAPSWPCLERSWQRLSLSGDGIKIAEYQPRQPLQAISPETDSLTISSKKVSFQSTVQS